MKRSKEQQEVADNLFDKFRDDLLSRDLSNTENYDKAILTLSASSLGLSLTAIKFVVPIATASYLLILKSAWALLVISVISSLVAYLISNKAISVQLKNARDYYKNDIENAFSRKNKFIQFNAFLNYLTGGSFSIAILLIVIFISINLENGEIIMSDKPKQDNKPLILDQSKTDSSNIEKDISTPFSASIPDIEAAPASTEKVITPNSSSERSANIPVIEPAPGPSTDNNSSKEKK